MFFISVFYQCHQWKSVVLSVSILAIPAILAISCRLPRHHACPHHIPGRQLDRACQLPNLLCIQLAVDNRRLQLLYSHLNAVRIFHRPKVQPFRLGLLHAVMHVAQLLASHSRRAALVAIRVYVLAPGRPLRLLQVPAVFLCALAPVLFHELQRLFKSQVLLEVQPLSKVVKDRVRKLLQVFFVRPECLVKRNAQPPCLRFLP